MGFCFLVERFETKAFVFCIFFSFPSFLLGVVEKIDGENLHLVFTQWEEDSNYYRELSKFGVANQYSFGVRKLTRGIIFLIFFSCCYYSLFLEEKLFWRKRMEEEPYNMWPRDWDEKRD